MHTCAPSVKHESRLPDGLDLGRAEEAFHRVWQMTGEIAAEHPFRVAAMASVWRRRAAARGACMRRLQETTDPSWHAWPPLTGWRVELPIPNHLSPHQLLRHN